MAEVKEDGAKVYQRKIVRMYERASFYLDEGDLVKILEKGKRKVRIKTRDGKEGWLERNALFFSSEKADRENYSSKSVTLIGNVFHPYAFFVADFSEQSVKESFREDIRTSRAVVSDLIKLELNTKYRVFYCRK
ncbi:MAG: hypothetical protein ACLFQK_10380 [Fibrobacterota bacterium]